MKKCTICGELKLPQEYYLNKRSNDGHQKHCKECHNVMAKKWETKPENRRKKREYGRIAMRAWREKNIELARKKHRDFVSANRERLNKRRSEKSLEKKLLIISHYGGRCSCCGIEDHRFLSIDHINNDGRKHRKERKVNIHDFIIKNGFPEDFQILCFNCNFGRAFHGGVHKICPHFLPIFGKSSIGKLNAEVESKSREVID